MNDQKSSNMFDGNPTFACFQQDCQYRAIQMKF